MTVAEENGFESIAFPLIGAGSPSERPSDDAVNLALFVESRLRTESLVECVRPPKRPLITLKLPIFKSSSTRSEKRQKFFP